MNPVAASPAVLMIAACAFAQTPTGGVPSILADPAFVAVREFADLMLEFGRDDYGSSKSPLFACQLNVETRRIPSGTETDPGVWNGHFEVAGYQPFCQNLLGDLGLLDVLKALSDITGDPKYDQARRDYLAYVLNSTRYPNSGYIPWGEHVGYDLVKDAIHVGELKYWHEVKAFNVPWDQLWEVNAEATRNEIKKAFRNHICDEITFAFNRHATMDGKPNTGSEPCSLLSSAGLYMDAWCWLYKKTGDIRFLDWTNKMKALASQRRAPETGLIPTDEQTRKDLMVYAEAASYAPFLFLAGATLGHEGEAFTDEALDLLVTYDRFSYTPRREDTGKPGYHDSVNVRSGKPQPVDKMHYLEPWKWTDNHVHPGTILSSAAVGYSCTGDPRLLEIADRALDVIDIPDAIAKQKILMSADAGGVIMSLITLAKSARRTPERPRRCLDAARPLVEYVLHGNRKNGLFTSGIEGKERYYCSRAGSGYLASAVLAFALAENGLWEKIPPVRDIEGGLRF